MLELLKRNLKFSSYFIVCDLWRYEHCRKCFTSSNSLKPESSCQNFIEYSIYDRKHVVLERKLLSPLDL